MSQLVDLKGTAPTLRRISAGLVVLVGIALVISTFSNNLFDVGRDFEEMIDDFRPAIEQESVATARADLAMLDRVGTEFERALVPALSQQVGMTDEEFVAYTATNFPDVAEGMQALPRIVPTFNGLVDTLDSQRELFESADAIPMKQLPATTVPWGLALSGAGLVAAGVLLYKPGSLGPILTGGLGLGILMVSLALNLLPKATDADELNDNLRPVYTPELVAEANNAVITVGAMGNQMQAEMLPALGQQLGMGQEELALFLAESFPTTAQALVSFPEAMTRFEGLVEIYDGNLDNYQTVETVSFAPIIGTLLTGSLIVLLATGASIWGIMSNGDKPTRPVVGFEENAIEFKRQDDPVRVDIREPLASNRPKVGQGPRI